MSTGSVSEEEVVEVSSDEEEVEEVMEREMEEEKNEENLKNGEVEELEEPLVRIVVTQRAKVNCLQSFGDFIVLLEKGFKFFGDSPSNVKVLKMFPEKYFHEPAIPKLLQLSYHVMFVCLPQNHNHHQCHHHQKHRLFIIIINVIIIRKLLGHHLTRRGRSHQVGNVRHYYSGI